MSVGHRYGLSRAELTVLFVEMEDETGYNSIPTIENMYRGLCVFPDCTFGSKDALAMWQHVHFGRKHGPSFDVTLRELVQQRRPAEYL